MPLMVLQFVKLTKIKPATTKKIILHDKCSIFFLESSFMG